MYDMLIHSLSLSDVLVLRHTRRLSLFVRVRLLVTATTTQSVVAGKVRTAARSTEINAVHND